MHGVPHLGVGGGGCYIASQEGTASMGRRPNLDPNPDTRPQPQPELKPQPQPQFDPPTNANGSRNQHGTRRDAPDLARVGRRTVGVLGAREVHPANRTSRRPDALAHRRGRLPRERPVPLDIVHEYEAGDERELDAPRNGPHPWRRPPLEAHLIRLWRPGIPVPVRPLWVRPLRRSRGEPHLIKGPSTLGLLRHGWQRLDPLLDVAAVARLDEVLQDRVHGRAAGWDLASSQWAHHHSNLPAGQQTQAPAAPVGLQVVQIARPAHDMLALEHYWPNEHVKANTARHSLLPSIERVLLRLDGRGGIAIRGGIAVHRGMAGRGIADRRTQSVRSSESESGLGAPARSARTWATCLVWVPNRAARRADEGVSLVTYWSNR